MKSKLGFHIDIQGHHGEVEKIIRAGTRVVKVISSMGMLRDLHDALGDKTVYIARDWKVTDDFLRFGGRDDPKGAAQRWMDGMRPAMVQAPFAYWESFNEMSNWDSLQQYGEFEAERQRLMHSEGFKACIGNFATGTPEIDGPNDKWPEFYPALEVANDLGNILGLHEYGGLWMDLWYGPNQSDTLRSGNRQPYPEEHAEGWLFGRYRKVRRLHLEPNRWTSIRIALTEFGLDLAGTVDTDFLAGYPTGAWRSCTAAWEALEGRRDGAQYYVEQLQWCDRQMQKDPYLLGCTIFTWGTLGAWTHFEIEGEVAEKLIEHISQTKAAPADTSSTDTTTPGEAPSISIYVTPIPRSGIVLRTGPGAEHDIVTVAHPGDKLGVLEDEQDALAKLGREAQWLHLRMPSDREGWGAAWLLGRFGESTPDNVPDTTNRRFVTPTAEKGIFVRSGPGVQHERIASVFIGDLLEVLDSPTEALDHIGEQGQWIKIRTPRGQNGWVAAWFVGLIEADGSAVPSDDEDTGDATPKELYVRTTAPDGLFVREGPGTTFRAVASIFPHHQLEVMEDIQGALEKLGRQNEWLEVRVPSGQVGYTAAWFLEEMPKYFVWPAGHALVGLHGPADPGEWPWTEDALQIFRTARIEGAKLMASGDIGGNTVKALQDAGVKFIMARLFGKFHEKRTPQQFVNEVSDAALRLYDSGVRYFEVHNEPNVHTEDSPEGMWIAWQDGGDFARFYLDAVQILRDMMPGAKFGFPGLSPGPDAQHDGKRIRMSSEVFLAQAEAAVQSADFLCVHAYWGGDGSPYTTAFKQIKRFCDRFPNKLVFCTEFSNNAPYVGKDVKALEYVQFYAEAKQLPPNLGALFAYVLSASYGYQHEVWLGSVIPERVGNRTM